MHPRRALGLVASLAMLLTACVPSAQSRAELPPTGPLAAQPAATDTQPAPAATAEVVETPAARVALQEYPVPAGSHPHDVAPAPDGGVWYTAQSAGKLGRLDPTRGGVRRFPPPPGRGGPNLNPPTSDHQGRLWFTGQNDVYGGVAPARG